MQAKLTLRLDEKLIKRAKAHAKRTGRSVSRLVADYFHILDRLDESATKEEISPKVQQLLGCLKGGREVTKEEISPKVQEIRGVWTGKDFTREDYRRYLEKKHR